MSTGGHEASFLLGAPGDNPFPHLASFLAQGDISLGGHISPLILTPASLSST